MYKFTFITTKHKLELFDKLKSPILNYTIEVWGFCQANECIFAKKKKKKKKKNIGGNENYSNDFVYRGLGRNNYSTIFTG